ncbi:histidine phosphatase family protein [Cohnella cholangitidis]|uniref:Histidine phosphatase family protein n=1 Tax=Cohnella cholangitidis TaxID=2598458 RepID=A0A7G5BYH3_9BACL|nr:histidine phosphatase family protein [Cohnella cholangitidis]QMV42007.1 histidine phosphatase family protein [Cohnella cholangitidis]
MKIGLVRHFKVKKEYPKGSRYSAAEVAQWFREYDLADIEPGTTELGDTEWNRCLASDMARARRTAELIYEGTVHAKSELREIPAPTFTTGLKLPFLAWAILIRTSWLFNRQARQDIAEAKERIKKVLDDAQSSDGDNVLIVSHAAMMIYMRKELVRRGFRGPKFKIPKNGVLHIYENEVNPANR